MKEIRKIQNWVGETARQAAVLAAKFDNLRSVHMVEIKN